MYFRTVGGETRMPSLTRSSWQILSSPHVMFATAISAISFSTPLSSVGCPFGRDFQRQKTRISASCPKMRTEPQARILEVFSKFAETSRGGTGSAIGKPSRSSSVPVFATGPRAVGFYNRQTRGLSTLPGQDQITSGPVSGGQVTLANQA